MRAIVGFTDSHVHVVAVNNPDLVDGSLLFIADVTAGNVCLGGNGGSGNFPLSHYVVGVGPRIDHSASVTNMVSTHTPSVTT